MRESRRDAYAYDVSCEDFARQATASLRSWTVTLDALPVSALSESMKPTVSSGSRYGNQVPDQACCGQKRFDAMGDLTAAGLNEIWHSV